MSTVNQLGPIFADIAGPSLTEEEKITLQHEAIGGVILFRKNFQDKAQLIELVKEIKSIKSPELLVMVDHEGGRVQRFTSGFTELPEMALLGRLYDNSARKAHKLAENIGWVIGNELLAVGIDSNLGPVLDVEYGNNDCLKGRSFHQDPYVVSELATHIMAGLHRAGMIAVGKHYPGHGYVESDTHVTLPEDDRRVDAIVQDLFPFKMLIEKGLDAIMTSHIRYVQHDQEIASYSSYWLEKLLRGSLKHKGIIFSDDLNMQAAHVKGPLIKRITAALDAGCDFVLACNDPSGVREVLDILDRDNINLSKEDTMSMLDKLRGTTLDGLDRAELMASSAWKETVKEITDYAKSNRAEVA